jgi:hypothetical protein
MNKKEAVRITGGLGAPSKMPGASYGIPAETCNVGSKLNLIEGSVCSKCYALKGFYQMPNVKASLNRRLNSIKHPGWVKAMAYLISNVPEKHRDHFRWHDSGDLQDLHHLLDIVAVCELTPNIKHWLPTREKGLIQSYLRNFSEFPENLIVRVSSAMIDEEPHPAPGYLTSTVHKKGAAYGFDCRAHYQENQCKDCRTCWDRAVSNVSYLAH